MPLSGRNVAQLGTRPARALLRAIKNNPQAVLKALAE
jgi:hypothetical protein